MRVLKVLFYSFRFYFLILKVPFYSFRFCFFIFNIYSIFRVYFIFSSIDIFKFLFRKKSNRALDNINDLVN